VHHDGRAPFSVKVRAASATHDAFAILAADDKPALLYRREHDDAIRLIQQIAGYAILCIDEFLERLTGFGE
jgi:cephalosporin-C deacetylase-like acetyl esterase